MLGLYDGYYDIAERPSATQLLYDRLSQLIFNNNFQPRYVHEYRDLWSHYFFWGGPVAGHGEDYWQYGRREDYPCP